MDCDITIIGCCDLIHGKPYQYHKRAIYNSFQNKHKFTKVASSAKILQSIWKFLPILNKFMCGCGEATINIGME